MRISMGHTQYSRFWITGALVVSITCTLGCGGGGEPDPAAPGDTGGSGSPTNSSQPATSNPGRPIGSTTDPNDLGVQEPPGDSEFVTAEQQRRVKAVNERYERRIKAEIEHRDLALNTLIETLKAITTVEQANEGLEALEDLGDDFRRAQSSLERLLDQYLREAKVKYRYTNNKPFHEAQIRAEFDRLKQDEAVKLVFERQFGPSFGVRSLLDEQPRDKNFDDPARNVNHPDYLLANATALSHTEAKERESALRRLLLIDPDSVTDEQQRAKIVEAYITFYKKWAAYVDSRVTLSLARWVGEDSTPIFMEVLEDKENDHSVGHVLPALALFPSAENAKVIARFIGHEHGHQSACRCLVNLGSIAEEAVLEIAPSESEKKSLAAIVVLGEIGTQKSIPLLTRAANSQSSYVRQAATEAIEKIRARGS